MVADTIGAVIDSDLNVPAEATPEAKKAAISSLLKTGKARQMPAWKDRLSDTEIKILTFYVHALGGGE